MDADDLCEYLRARPETVGLRLLVLHGSRARGDAGDGSDWDFGYLAGDGFDAAGLVVALTTALGTDAVDVVDLARTNALLRYRAARDGRALVERPVGELLEFQLEAVRFWCDAGPVIRAAQDDVLAALG